MKAPRVGYKAPIFFGECTSNNIADLSQLKGKKVILYFYPKDSTPGCTTEGQDFRDLYKKFAKANAVIYGLSRDSIKSHETFKEKQSFPFDLISDPTEEICKQYDVIKEKNMYGRKYMGIDRSTFLINEEGKLIKEWRKVKVKGHADEVLKEVESNPTS